VWEQARLLEDAGADLAQVAERGAVADRSQEGTVLGEEGLGLVTQEPQ